MRQNLRQACAWLFSIEAYILLGLTGVGMVLTRYTVLAVGAGVLFLVLRKALWGRFSKPTPIDIQLLVIAGMGLVSYAISPLKEISAVQTWRLLTGLVLFWGLVNGLRGRREVSLFLWLFMLAGVFLVVSSPLTVNWVDNPVTRVFTQIRERLNFSLTDTIHPNVLAGTLVLLFPIPFAELIFGWGGKVWLERIVLVGLCGLYAGTMVIAQSRGAVLAVGVVMVVYVVMRWRWSWVGILVGGAVLSGVIMRVGINEMMGFLMTSPGLGGIEGRVELWSRAIYMIQDFPFTGVGIGLYSPVADTLYPFFLMAPGQISHAHNLFLQIAVDIGLPGLIAWLGCLLVSFWMAGKIILGGKMSGDHWLMVKGMAMLGVNTGMVVHGMLDAAVWGMVKPAPLVWGLWGMAAVVFLLVEENHLSRRSVV